MGKPHLTAPAGMDYEAGYHLISEQRMRHLIIPDDSCNLAGLVTEGNFLEHLGGEFLVRLKEVSALMTRNVLTLPEDATVEDAVRLMAHQRISCIVVEDAGRPVWIITERDLVRQAAMAEAIASRPLAAAMSHPVHSVAIDTPLPEAMQIMDQARLRHLVVLDEQGSIAGLVTHHDIVKQLYDHQVEKLWENLRTRNRNWRQYAANSWRSGNSESLRRVWQSHNAWRISAVGGWT